MGKNIFTLAMCVLFALSVVPFDVQEAGYAQAPYTQEAERTQSPFVIVTSAEEVFAVAAMSDGSIPVTNIMIPEIVNRSIRGIIITEQDLEEALAILNEAYLVHGHTIQHLVTPWVLIASPSDEGRIFPVPAKIGEVSDNDNAIAKPFGTSPPTQFPPTWSTLHDWSGTINFTFSRFITPSFWFFNTQADTPHFVNYRSSAGSIDLGTIISSIWNGRHTTPGIGFAVHSYSIIHNSTWGVPSRNATWRIRD